MCVTNWALLTPLDNLAALPFSLDHGKAGAVEDLCADGLLERLAHELRAGVGVLEISHAGSAPILHHVTHESVETEEMLSEIDRAGMMDGRSGMLYGTQTECADVADHRILPLVRATPQVMLPSHGSVSLCNYRRL